MTTPIAANDNDFCYYTYIWRRPCGQPFYVGKGKGKRAYETYDRSNEFNEIYNNGRCTVDIVDWFIHESQAFAREIELIAQYGRRDYGGILVNKSDGGEGLAGHVKSPETIKRWRAKNLGRKNTADVIAKMSASKIGHYVSADARANMSAAAKRRFEVPEERSRIRAASSNPSKETRSRMRNAQILRLLDPVWFTRFANARLGVTHTSETRARISATMSGIPKTEDTVDNMRSSQRMRPGRQGYKGVSVAGNKWRAIICVDGRNQSIGTFSVPEDAALAYDKAAVSAWGLGNCYLNFPSAANGNEPQILAHVA